MSSLFRPLKAPQDGPHLDPDFTAKLPYPLLGSPKMDGIRAITLLSGKVFSNKMLELPSAQVQSELSGIPFIDGEIVEGIPHAVGVYNRTQSLVMSADKFGDLHYYVFDCLENRQAPYYRRLESAKRKVANSLYHSMIPQKILENENDLLRYESEMLLEGYEGVMLRTADSPYKLGRATFREQIIYKLKRFQDMELPICGVEEGDVNNNEMKTNEIGLAKRSSSKEGLVPSGMVGTFLVAHPEYGVVRVAPGHLKKDTLAEMLQNPPTGQLLKFRFMSYGVKDAPRHCRAIGIRSEID